MKHKQSIAAMLLMVSCASAQANEPLDTVKAFHAALAATDKVKALAQMAPNVLIFEAGHVEHGLNEYASQHLADDMDFAKSTQSTVLKQIVRKDGKLAVITAETETSGTFKDQPVHNFGTETILLERKGDAWLITHVHWSSRKLK